MGFHKGNYSLTNAIIEFNMIPSPNPWNLNQIKIWIQIGAAGIRKERNHWSERKSETFIIKNLMSHWTFIKSRDIQCNMLLKPLRVDSWPAFDDEKWIQDLISLIFVEKTTHSLNARAGADSRASSETARPGEFQTFTCKPGSAKRCKQRVYRMPIRNVTETTFRNCPRREFTQELREQRIHRAPIKNVTETTIKNCANREFKEFQLETLEKRRSRNVANKQFKEFQLETWGRRTSEGEKSKVKSLLNLEEQEFKFIEKQIQLDSIFEQSQGTDCTRSEPERLEY